MKPFVSVIIPTYNSGATLKDCLRSVFASKYKNFEVIIADDKSKDRTRQIAKEFGCEIVTPSKRKGPAHARNEGVKIAKGNILFFIDSDVVLFPDSINIMLDTFRKNKVDAVTGIYYKEPANKGFAQLYKALFTHYWWYGNGRLKETNIFQAACAAIKKNVFNKLNGFNSNIKWGMDFENEEFGYRIAKSYRIVINPKLQVKHHFPSFIPFLKLYFTRTIATVRFALYRKGFDKGGNANPFVGIGTTGALLSLFLFLLSTILFLLNASYFNLVFYPSLLFLFLFLVVHSSFYFFVLKEKGLLISIGSVAMSYIAAVIVTLAAITTIVDVTLRRNPVYRLKSN